MSDWRDDRIGAAHRGENPMVLLRMRSGFAVIGDTQHLPGYCLLLCQDAAINHLSDLPWRARQEFLFDLALLGEAVEFACRDDGLRRVNYEVLGNAMEWLHGHVHARYDWEPANRIGWPVSSYPEAERNATVNAYDAQRHGELRTRLTSELDRLCKVAYALPRDLDDRHE